MVRKPKQKVITFVIDTEVDEAVERMAKKQKMFKSAVLSDAIRAYIGKVDQK